MVVKAQIGKKRGRKPRPLTKEDRWFGAVLNSARMGAGKTQEEVARHLGLSTSFFAKIERGEIRGDFSRSQVWSLIELLKLTPPVCDRLLLTSGHHSHRSAIEELVVRSNFHDLREIWFFSDFPTLALHTPFTTPLVSKFFTTQSGLYVFDEVVAKATLNLLSVFPDRPDVARDDVRRQFECILLPEEMFYMLPSILYNPGRAGMISSGIRAHLSTSAAYFTNAPSDTDRLHDRLSTLYGRIKSGKPIQLAHAQIVYPPDFRIHVPFISPPVLQAVSLEDEQILAQRLSSTNEFKSKRQTEADQVRSMLKRKGQRTKKRRPE